MDRANGGAGMKAGLIGLGLVADTHVAAIAATAGKVALGGVYARDPQARRDFAARHGGVTCYGSVADMAADPTLDFVIVATPPNARLEIVKTLIAGAKPILMEKPIERNFKAAQEIVTLCENATLPLGVVLQHRVRPASRELLGLLAKGTLGQIRAVELRVPWWRDQSYYEEPGRGTYARDGGGVLITQAIHSLDLMLLLAGPVAAVQAMTATTGLHELESEDHAAAGVQFASGAVGSVMATTAAFPGAGEMIALYCDKGTAVLDAAQLSVTCHDGTTERFGAPAQTGGGADPMGFGAEWHQAIIEDFASALAQSRPPIASGRSALGVQALIDAMHLSSREGRKVTLKKEG